MVCARETRAPALPLTFPATSPSPSPSPSPSLVPFLALALPFARLGLSPLGQSSQASSFGPASSRAPSLDLPADLSSLISRFKNVFSVCFDIGMESESESESESTSFPRCAALSCPVLSCPVLSCRPPSSPTAFSSVRVRPCPWGRGDVGTSASASGHLHTTLPGRSLGADVGSARRHDTTGSRTGADIDIPSPFPSTSITAALTPTHALTRPPVRPVRLARHATRR